ncbi:MAG: hypothetical protein ACJAVK_001256 [Akkermansiaceae bacterium]|jgi:hypothetical protein
MMGDGVRTIRLSGEAGATGQQGLGDAEQVQGFGARDEIFAVLFSFVCADTHDEIIVFAERGGEVGDIRGFVLAAEKDLVLGNLAAAGGGRDLLDEEVDAGGVVLHRKGRFENVAVAVTDQCDVFALGIVEGDAEDLAGVPVALENRPDEHVLIAIDRGDFGLFGSLHSTTKVHIGHPQKVRRSSQASSSPNGLARLLRTVQKWYQGVPPAPRYLV